MVLIKKVLPMSSVYCVTYVRIIQYEKPLIFIFCDKRLITIPATIKNSGAGT